MHRNAVAPLVATLALALALALAGCGGRQDPPSPQEDASLLRYASCDELEEGFAYAYVEQLVSWRYGYGWDVAMEDGGTASSAGDAPSDYSVTNVQEVGVDEPDLVETNGNYIYVIDPSWYGTNVVHVVATWPVEEAVEVGTLRVGGSPYSMFLYEDRLVIYSYVYDLPTEDPYRYGYGTRISVVDVSDPSAPTVLRELDLEGWMASARRIDADVYTVVHTDAWMPEPIYALMADPALPDTSDYWTLSPEEQAAVRDDARRVWYPQVSGIVQGMGAERLLPRVWDHAPGEQVEPHASTACTDVYHPPDTSRPSLLTVAHLELDGGDGSELSTTSLMADGWQVYASSTALYVAQSSWWSWWGWDELEQTTSLHRFELDGADTTYVASGSVPGWTGDQFSFSEHEGYVRVATSDFWWWGCGTEDCDEERVPANNVFVLQQVGASLDVVGEVRGIAPGEMIQAVRFLGDLAFMVTFRQTDPLFSLDLSDPTRPRVAGELVMPGFSSYLHPVGDDHLLAVGMAGTESGEITGLKVSLFDVSDLANPAIAEEIELTTGDWSGSEALWDHHAFTYHRDTLALPFYSYDVSESTGSAEFSGVLEIAVDTAAGSLEEVGRVSHQDLVEDSVCVWDEYVDRDAESTGADVEEFSSCDDYWYATVRRSVVIEDNLVSISDYGLKITDLADPEQVIARVLFYPAE